VVPAAAVRPAEVEALMSCDAKSAPPFPPGVAAAPMIPPLMAARVRLQQSIDFGPDCERVTAPTLIVTGEDGLDFVVPAEITRRFLTLIPGSRYVKIERSGHIGLLTQPVKFADAVESFLRTPDAEPRTLEPVGTL